MNALLWNNLITDSTLCRYASNVNDTLYKTDNLEWIFFFQANGARHIGVRKISNGCRDILACKKESTYDIK